MSAFSLTEEQAMQLTADERERLALKLMESLLDEGLSEAEKAWLPVIEGRYQKFKAGETHPVPAAEALAQIRKELGWRK